MKTILLLLFSSAIYAQSFLIESGGYTGDGEATQVVTVGLNLTESGKNTIVVVKGNTTQNGVWRGTVHGADSCSFFVGVADATDGIKSFSGTTFTVGNGAYVNSNTVAYKYIAIVADSAYLTMRRYRGDGATARQVDVGIAPAMAWVKSISTGLAVWHTTVMGGDSSISFFGTVGTNWLDNFSGTNIVVDNNAQTNSNGVWYRAVAFKDGAYIDVFRYNGNSITPRTVNFNKTLVDAEWISIGKENANTTNIWRSGQSGAPYVYSNLAAQTGKITAFTDSTVSLDDHVLVNSSAVSNRYYAFVFGDYAPPVITSLSTESGLVGSTVVISGSNFTGTTAVKFYNNVTATFNVDNDGQITATVPAGATTGVITVTNPSGSATSSAFTVLSATATGKFKGNDYFDRFKGW